MPEISRTFGAASNTNPVRYNITSQITSATFQINNAKLYFTVVCLLMSTVLCLSNFWK